MTAELPHRPWTRDDVPVVWRSDTCIEMGFPPRQVRIEEVGHALVSWLIGLGGDRTLDAALADGQATGLATGAMRRMLTMGVRAGLVDDAAEIPTSLRDAAPALRDMLHGDVASARHVHGDGRRVRDLIDRRRGAEVAVHGVGQVADALALVLTGAGIGNVIRSMPTPSSSRRHRRLAVDRACHVLCDSPHPDAAADHDAMALDIPHLAVSASGAQAVIGPLVIPGRTSCLRCRDLHLADADPQWPRIAVQWAGRRPPPVAAGLAHLAGAWAALHVLALLDEGPEAVTAPAIDGALIIELPGAYPVCEARPPHPLCGCRWPGTGHGRAVG